MENLLIFWILPSLVVYLISIRLAQIAYGGFLETLYRDRDWFRRMRVIEGVSIVWPLGIAILGLSVFITMFMALTKPIVLHKGGGHVVKDTKEENRT